MHSLRYQKGSVEISYLCNTKVSSTSVSQISIGTLKSKKLLQLEALCATGGWKNSSEFSEFHQMGAKPISYGPIMI